MTGSDKIIELVEINLLYAMSEMQADANGSALTRARRHLACALKDLRSLRDAAKPAQKPAADAA